MEETKFAMLLRKAADQTTRRQESSTLLGGAMVPNQAGAMEGTEKAERRTNRKRKQDRSATIWRSVWIRVLNTDATSRIQVDYGTASAGIGQPCCNPITTQHIPAGEYRDYNARTGETGFIYINRKYWFQFTNPLIEVPYAQIAINGAFAGGPGDNVACCYKAYCPGNTVEFFRKFKQGQTRFYNIEGTARFRVRRHSNLPDFVFFEVTPPPTLVWPPNPTGE